MSGDGGLTAGRMSQPAKHTDGGRLARAIGAEEAEYDARRDRKREILNSMDVAETFAEMIKNNDWLPHV